MKKIMSCIFSILLVLSMAGSASACSLLYVGGKYTDDGANMFVRVEDGDLDDEVKYYLVSPAGNRKAGEKYESCYGFIWTFTHDSYRYISRRDNNMGIPCINCQSTHDHQPYEEAGTNEFGLTLTATQSLDPNSAAKAVDPFREDGLSESEIPTILLSECATAREAVYLLKDIVETRGLYDEGFGVMLCDQKEQWYCEAVSSQSFLAFLLPRDLVFFNANVSLLGLIDLDDENIIASEGIIPLAQKAGTFIGNAEENVIDYRRSLTDYTVTIFGEVWSNNVFTRTSLVLNQLEGTNKWTPENCVEDNDFVITNIGDDGSIVPPRNNVQMTAALSLDDVLDLLDLYPLGYWENIESHLYRFYPNADPEMGIVEWSSMDNNRYNVFVPGYPVLMTDTWEGYRTPVPMTVMMAKDIEYWKNLLKVTDMPFVEMEGDRPESRDCYTAVGELYINTMQVDVTGLWHVFPEGWEKNYSDVFSALSNWLCFMSPGDEAIALTDRCFARMQQDFIERFDDLTARLLSEEDLTTRQEIATRESSLMAEESQNLALALYRHFVYGEEFTEPAD